MDKDTSRAFDGMVDQFDKLNSKMIILQSDVTELQSDVKEIKENMVTKEYLREAIRKIDA